MADSVQAQCEKCIDVWLRGDRNDAGPTKQALLQLIQQHPKNSLPRRYLARLMFHEAAGAISPGSVGSNSSLQRIQLLTDAYEHAAVATALSPNSLSCAALRATLAINLLVEESALLTPTPPSTSTSGGSKAGSEQQSQQQQQASSCTMLDRKCQELLQRFLGSIDACKTALEHPNPVLREPLITFTTATHTTCDPCSLLVEKIMDCSRAGKLQEVVAEKRSVLTSMQQVLQSCYALLDSTQVPLHSIIRLLQHILRPYGAEQQMLASSRVNSSSPTGAAAGSSNPAAQLPASQLHHAAIGELLRLLRPGSNQACSSAAIAATTAAAAAAATAAGNAAAAMAGAAAAAVVVAPAAAICEAPGSGPATDDGLAPLPLSVEKPWDPPSTATASSGSKTAAGNARGAGKGRGGRSRAGGAAAGPGKKRERSRRERFMDVESFWRSCSPQQRLQLLRVPLAPLLAGVKQESGAPAAEVLMEGLVLLREQEHSSCYWLCAACDRKFHTARDFNTHLETCHEQLVLAKQQQQLPLKAPMVPPGPPAAGKALAAPHQQQLPVSLNSSSLPPPVKYISCGKCQAPVVGMYYIRTPPAKPLTPQTQPQTQQPAATAVPGGDDAAAERMRTICIKCYRELTTLMGAAGAERSYCMVTPHAPLTPSSSWSGSGSEFISTRDSFSSCAEDDGASSGSLADSEDADTATAAGATARSMQLRQYDSTRGGVGGSHGVAAGMPEGKPRGQPWPAWRLQQQRALAWRTHMPETLRCSSSQGCGRACGPTANGPQAQQQPGHRQQQQQASAPSPGPGIFVFGSSSNTASGAGAGSSCPASGSNAAGSFVPTSPVPATAACASAGTAAAPAGPSEVGVAASAAVQSGLLSPSSCSSSPVRQPPPPPQPPASATGSSGLAAYWQQQQLLLCSADAAAVELLDGLDIVQRAKQLNSHQRRASAAAAHTSQRLSGPVAGTKRPAAAADGEHPSSSAAAGCVSSSQGDSVLPPSVPAFQAQGAVHTGLLADSEAAAGEYGTGVGPDTWTPSASNRTWRDWLLPKKLLQWNDGEDEGWDGSELYGRRGSLSSDDSLDDVIARGLGQAYTGGPGVGQVTPAAAGATGGGLPDGSGGCSSSAQQQGQRVAVPTVVITELSDEPAAGVEGPEQGAGSAPCSPRTPSAQDSCRGGADAGVSSSGAVVALPGSSSSGAAVVADAAAVSAATAAAVAAAAAGHIDSLGACLAAAAPAVLVDELIRCMQHLYSTDADIADEALHCLVDFLQRKLNPKGYCRVNCDTAVAAMVGASRRCNSGITLSLEQLSPAAADAAAAAGLSEDEAALAAELLAAPELAFMCPRAMRAAMCCLSSSDLHMALAYIVRQSGAPLAGACCVDVDSTCGSSIGGSLASSSGAGSVTGEEDLGDTASQTDSQESDEESGCMALFQLYHLDEVAFEELVTHLWPGEFRLRGDAPASDATTAAAGKGGAPAAAQVKHLRGGAQQGRPSGKAPAGGAAASSQGSSQVQKDRLEPVLLVAPWWLEHLRQSSKAKDQTGDAEADMRVLRWVYGNIESAQAEELAGRQAALRGGLDRTSALWELYEGLAEAWRRMQRVADGQRRLEQLRSRVKAKFAEVKALEDAAQHGTSQQAAAFLESLRSSLTPPPAPAQLPVLPASCAPNSAPAETALVPAPPADTAPAQQQQPPAACAAAAAAVSLSPLMQLTTYMTKLAPLYLCEPAVAAVRTAPLLASEASQHYACTLLERELAVLALMEAKLEHDVALARQRLQAANDRLLAKRGTELTAAEAEQSKLIAEGPASHRKKDLLDKATKETEHRQKLADVKARIEAANAAIAEDEALAASAELAAAEGTAALLHVQDLARQMNMRLKTLQDFNAQLAALLPPLHAPAPVAASVQQQRAAAGPGSSCASSGSAAYGSRNSNSVDSSACSSSPQVDGEPALPPAAAPAAPSASADAHAEWTLRARRLECLMCRVLWVAETIRLFDGQYDTHSVSAGSTSTSTVGGSSGPGAAPAQGAAAGGPAQGLVGPQGYSQARTTPTDMLSASRWVKAQGEELDANFHAAAEELGLLRSRIQQLACVDLTFELHEAALNYVRRRIEAASTAAQEMRSQQLLLELAAEEEAAKKAAAAPTKQQQQQHAQAQAAAAATAAAAAEARDKGGSAAAASGHAASQGAAPGAVPAAATQQQTSGKAGKGKKGKQQEQSKAAASKPTPKATSKQQIQQDAAAAAETAKLEAAERLQAREAARAAREAAIEAELEKRRQELLAMEEAAEAELIRLAEEASLREQQALKEAAEKECQKKEQQAREAAAAAAAAAAPPVAPAVNQSPSKQQQQPGSGSPLPVQAGSARTQQGAAGRVSQGKQQGAAAARGAQGSAAGTAELGQVPVGITSPVRLAAAHRASRAPQTTGPGAAAQAVSRDVGKQAAPKPSGSMPGAAAVPAAAQHAPAALSKRQQQVAGAATAAGSAPAGKKGGRGGQAASAGGRGGKGQPGSAGSTPSKQQRSQHKQQERGQLPPPPPPPQAVPVMLDFGPTPAEAYAAKQAQGANAAAGSGAAAEQAAPQEASAQQHLQEQQQQQQHMPSSSQQQHAPQALPVGAVSAGTAGPAYPAAAAPGLEAFGLTAADAVVHMPSSTASSSSHLALLSQGHADSSMQLQSIPSNEPRGRFDSSSAPLSAAPGSAFAAAASVAPPGAAAAGVVALVGTSAGLTAPSLGHSHGSQAFTADAPLTGFSPAPGGPLLSSVGSGHLQYPGAAAAAAGAAHPDSSMGAFSSSNSLLPGLSASGQGFGSQDMLLGFGLGAVGGFSASRQGSAGLQGPGSSDLASELPPSLSAGGSKGVAAVMGVSGVGAAVSAPLAVGSGPSSGHMRPPRPALGAVGGAGDSLLGGGGLDPQRGMFGQAGGAPGLGVQLQSAAGRYSGLDSVLQEPESPQLGCSPAGDALHIQSIMSLLDDTGSSSSTHAQPAAAAMNAASGSGGGRGRQGKKQQQDQQKQPQRQQQRQRGQKGQHMQQQQQQRPGSRGRNSPAPDSKAATQAGRGAEGLAPMGASSGSISSGLESFGQVVNPSASSSVNSSMSPMRPPGLSGAGTTGSLSSRPSSAGSTSTAPGEGLGGVVGSSQRQQQMKQGGPSAAAAAGSGQLWGGSLGAYGGTMQGSGAGQAYSSSSWAGAGSMGFDAGVPSSSEMAGGRGAAGQGAYAAAGTRDGTAAANAAMAAGGGVWAGPRPQMPSLPKGDLTAGRDQQRPNSAGLGGYPSAAQATQHAQAHAHMAAATAAAAAAAAATAAVKQAQQQAAAVAAHQASGGLRSHSPGLAGLYSQGQQDMAALFGGSSNGFLGAGGPMGGLSVGQGYFDATGGFGGLTSGALSGGLGAPHGGMGPGLADVAGLWQQQQQAAAMRYPGGFGGLQQSLQQQQQQQQQQQMWAEPPSAGGGQGAQW